MSKKELLEIPTADLTKPGTLGIIDRIKDIMAAG
jgi:hypothetical protein